MTAWYGRSSAGGVTLAAIVRVLGERGISKKRNSGRHSEMPWSPIR